MSFKNFKGKYEKVLFDLTLQKMTISYFQKQSTCDVFILNLYK